MRMSRVFLASIALVGLSCARELTPPPSIAKNTPIAATTQTITLHASPDAATLQRLRTFKSVSMHSTDQAADSMLEAINPTIPDNQLEAVANYTKSEEGKPIAWPLGKLLVERGRFDLAADVFVTSLANVDDKQYGMWKWWEYNFRDRPDYDQLSWKIGDAFVTLFSTSTSANKRVIAEIFGKSAEDAKLSALEFRQMVLANAKP